MDIRSGFAEVNGAKLYYEEAGQGKPLVMVHAGIADHRMWDDQFAVFAGKYRVIRYDQRGFGQSMIVPGEYAASKDLLGVMDFLGVQKAYLMGCSMGGQAVIDFAVQHPERAAALIPVGSGLSGFEYDNGSGGPPPIYMELEAAEKAHEFDKVAELSARIWVDSPSRTPDQVDPAVRQKVKDMVLTAMRNDPNDVGKPQPITPPAIQRLDALKMPMMVIIGDLDNPVIATIADTLVNEVPGARKVILTGTAHLPNMERPEDFNQVVMGFLAGIEGG